MEKSKLDTSNLMLKAILGTLTEEEAEDLLRWREADEENERLYQQTVSTDFLEREYRRRQGVGHERPLQDMKARISNSGQSRQLRWWRAAAIFAAVMALGSIAYTYIESTRARQGLSEIHAGSAQATLQVASLPALPVSEGAVTESSMTSQELLAAYRRKVSALNSKSSTLDAQSSTLSLSLSTPRGGEFRITLEDGTEVLLNAQSQLIYPETFAADERRVQVKGEAYFRVARDEQKPFIVETDGQALRVLGTEFNVHSYDNDPSVETTLVSGSIALQPLGAGDAQLLLTPGHQAVFSKAGRDIQVRSVDTEVVTSWKDGKFVFENQTLEQIMLTLSRWYDFEYEFADASAAKTVFMGRIPRYADFADVVEILESSGGLRIQVSGRKVVVENEE